MYYVKEVGIDELDVQEWNDLLLKSEVCDALQSYEWAQVLKNSTGAQSHFLMVRNKRETIGGLMFFKKRILGILDCYDVGGGPLYYGKNKLTVMKNILKTFRKKKEKSLYTLFVPSPLISQSLTRIFRSEGYCLLPLRTLIINLEKPIEQVWRALDKKARWGVRKAERLGVEAKIASDWQEWKEYYQIYMVHSKRKQYSAYTCDFFEEMFKLHHKNMCRLFIAKYGGRIIAGSLFLIYRENMIFLQNASLDAFLAYNPNNLIQWRSIEWAAGNGVKTYDFKGLPEKATYLSGEYEYKKRWDGHTQPYYHFFGNKPSLIGVRMIRKSFFAWKLFTRLRDFGLVQR